MGDITETQLQHPGDMLSREKRQAALRRIIEAVKAELEGED